MDHAQQTPPLGDAEAGDTQHHEGGRPGPATRPPRRTPRRLRLALALPSAAILVAFSVGVAPALTTGFLPGGTPLTVDNTSPVDGDEFNVPGTTIDITDEGSATIGAGVPITAVYAVDTSGSMTVSAGVDCDGVAGNDTRMVCAQEGVAAANATAADPLSPIELTGLASFADAGATHDVDLGTVGNQLLVAPDFDGNGNTVARPRGRRLHAGRRRADELRRRSHERVLILNDPSNTNTTNLLLFLSDADDQSVMVGANVSTLAASVPAGHDHPHLRPGRRADLRLRRRHGQPGRDRRPLDGGCRHLHRRDRHLRAGRRHRGGHRLDPRVARDLRRRRRLQCHPRRRHRHHACRPTATSWSRSPTTRPRSTTLASATTPSACGRRAPTRVAPTRSSTARPSTS